MAPIVRRGSGPGPGRVMAMATAVAIAVTGGLVAGTGASAGTSKHRGKPASNAVLDWNASAGEAAIAAGLAPLNNPLHESRAYAMMHIAVHDALNAIDRRYVSYAYAGVHPAGRLCPGRRCHRRPRRPGSDPSSDFLSRSRSIGHAGAASIEARLRRGDRRDRRTVGRSRPGSASAAAAAAVLDTAAGRRVGHAAVRCGVPARRRARASGGSRRAPTSRSRPAGADVTPFALADAAQFLPGPPPPVASRRYTATSVEVKRLGGDGVTTPSERTADQTEIALFWLESSPLGWNRIARTVAAKQHLGLWQSARLFALLNMALADGYIATFDDQVPLQLLATGHGDPARRHRRQPLDHTPTRPGHRWSTTPPIPDYDSGARGRGRRRGRGDAAGASAPTGSRFSSCSLTLPAGSACADPGPVRRKFSRLSRGGRARTVYPRILVGFHFRTAVRTGLDLGESVGDLTARRYLRRVR